MKKTVIILVVLSLITITVPTYAFGENYPFESGTKLPPSTTIAQIYLEQLASREHSERMIGGGIVTGIGGGLSIIGLANIGNDMAPPFLLIGGLTTGTGALALALPGNSEKELAKIQLVTDPIVKEQMAEESLSYLADKAKSNRIIGGIISTGLGIFHLIIQPYSSTFNMDLSFDLTQGLLYSVSGIYELLTPSYPEKLYNQLLHSKNN